MDLDNIFRSFFGLPKNRSQIDGDPDLWTRKRNENFDSTYFYNENENKNFESPEIFIFGGNNQGMPKMGEIFEQFDRTFSNMDGVFHDIFLSSEIPMFVEPKKESNPCEEMLKDSHSRNGNSGAKFVIPFEKKDSDLDGQKEENLISALLENPKSNFEQLEQDKTPKSDQRSFFQFQSSFHKSTNIDGRIEEIKSVQDSSGQKETVITRTLGDKSYSITTKSDPNGRREETKVFTNLSEDLKKDFDEKWNSSSSTDRNVAITDDLLPKNNTSVHDDGYFKKLYKYIFT